MADVADINHLCQVGSRIVVIGVRNYADDHRTHEYQAVGLTVALSVRVVPPRQSTH